MRTPTHTRHQVCTHTCTTQGTSPAKVCCRKLGVWNIEVGGRAPELALKQADNHVIVRCVVPGQAGCRCNEKATQRNLLAARPWALQGLKARLPLVVVEIHVGTAVAQRAATGTAHVDNSLRVVLKVLQAQVAPRHPLWLVPSHSSRARTRAGTRAGTRTRPALSSGAGGCTGHICGCSGCVCVRGRGCCMLNH